MTRRGLLLLLGAAMAAPRALRAQQNAKPAIGLLSSSTPPGPNSLWLSGFRQGLSEAGYVEGHNTGFR